MNISTIEKNALKDLSDFADGLNAGTIKLDLKELAAYFCSACALLAVMHEKIKRLENLLQESPRI